MVDGPVKAWHGKADRTYAQLRSDIENGALGPGQVLSELDLVSYTGASRTPVREALRRLAAEGLVDLEPRRAPRVSRVSLKRARALFDFRRLLEPAAVRSVAERAPQLPVVRADFSTLGATFEQLVADQDSEFLSRFRTTTASFDELVTRHATNEFVAAAIADLWPQSARLRHIARADHTRLQQSVSEHRQMCELIAGGRADEASAAMVEHLDHVELALFTELLARPDRAG